MSDISICPRCEGEGVYNHGPCSVCCASGRIGPDGNGMSHFMPPPDLRLTLLWHFGSTDPEIIHETCTECISENAERPGYQEMLRKAAKVQGES